MSGIFRLRGLLLVFGLIQLLLALVLALQVPEVLMSGSVITWGLVASLILTGLGLLKIQL